MGDDEARAREWIAVAAECNPGHTGLRAFEMSAMASPLGDIDPRAILHPPRSPSAK